MDASALRLLEVAPVAIAVVVVTWHFHVERRAAVAMAEEDARAPHA
jgi:hypothetical protein